MKKTTKEYLKDPYSRVLIPVEKGVFFAEILEFQGCYAEGKTPTEAFNKLERAAINWIEAAQENGQAIPEPSASPGYSGKVVLRLPKSLHRKAAQYAERDRSSLNQFFTCAIAAQVGAEEFSARLLQSFAQTVVTFAHIYARNSKDISRDVSMGWITDTELLPATEEVK